MGQEIQQEETIPSWAKRLLEKRDSAIRQYENDLNQIQSDGVINKSEAQKISRRSRDIQNFDTRLQRSGFIPPQSSAPTSKTTQITLPQLGFEQSSGFNISPRRGGGGGGGTVPVRQPWDLYVESENLVSVETGVFDGVLPSNWNIEGPSGARKVPCVGSGIFYAKAIVATDGTQITNVQVLIDQNPPSAQTPTPFATATQIEYLFGLFSSGQTFRVIGDGHIVAKPQIWLTTDRPSPAAAGQLPYQFYYLVL